MNIIYKIVHLFVSILFIYFAVVQFNDVDGKEWILIYAVVAILAILAFFKKSNIFYNYFLIGLFTALLIHNFHYFSEWINAGKPAFIDYEPTHIKEVEGIREFLGIVISFFVVVLYSLSHFINKKRHSSNH